MHINLCSIMLFVVVDCVALVERVRASVLKRHGAVEVVVVVVGGKRSRFFPPNLQEKLFFQESMKECQC
jgi:uncharacterized protein